MTAAREALDSDDVSRVLAFVPEADEDEGCALFDDVRAARALGMAAREVADRFFFETVVRGHRAGEGAPLHRAEAFGTACRPAIPLAEDALRTVERLARFLVEALQQELTNRLERVQTLVVGCKWSVGDARRYVQGCRASRGIAACCRRSAHRRTTTNRQTGE